MIGRPRAALAALLPACIVFLAPARASAQAASPHAGPSGAPALLELPAAVARPPASRVTPGGKVIHPPPPVVRRPAVERDVNPVSPLRTSPVAPNGESWAQITPDAVNAGGEAFPVGPGLRGPSVLRVQVLLDRALFSPGMIDGSWGKNTSVSVYWLQAREGLPATGVVDSATYARLQALAGHPQEMVVRHTLTAAEVRGPFTEIPSNIYEQAKMNCSCYESLSEKLTEVFHSRAELLRQLNPGVALNALKAGDAIYVPNVRDASAPPKGTVETLVVSGPEHYLQALDAQGRILYHFPTTLGSSYDPSPEGSFTVMAITENPWWKYQPKLLHHGHEDMPDADIPPGPNSAVGRVWMTLSAGHYGIHGTKSPETIGYAVSAGCVRLTNWDAVYLARRLTPGTAVVFRGTRTHPQAPAAPGVKPAAPAVIGVRADSVAPARADSARRDSAKRDSTRRDSTRRDTSRSAPQPDSAPAKTQAAPPPAASAAKSQPASPAAASPAKTPPAAPSAAAPTAAPAQPSANGPATKADSTGAVKP